MHLRSSPGVVVHMFVCAGINIQPVEQRVYLPHTTAELKAF